ncbi:oxidoreductase [Sulfobacillus acidophilus TPY]|uniref:2,5-didehydrogluconate reductase n=1 Tax=Sulfobacillus acidophilus (strain ATCC 700253 / DSM 10332 / NAL) TaxID=679936 RepID=G8TSD4_SULAD|nr:oxidoreductase [Sulfobacillus acidophilus TPY]AEW05546.1 2,5-didehydrogluconate reductase [Sulfobacillus acidophilus DSM 10332]
MTKVLIEGEEVPAIGQGTWRLGHDPKTRSAEVDALRYGIAQGLTLIDTAEMYADGGAEQVVGEAVRDVSETVFIVSKVWPNHASYDGVLHALQQSLNRLGRPYVDLYLLHWPSRHYPLVDTLNALVTAKRQGLARHIGVSNFPADLLEQALAITEGAISVNQVEYHLLNRRAEHRLLGYYPRVATMAYSPVKGLTALESDHPGRQVLQRLAETYQATPETVALAWLIAHPGVVAIPKAVHREHIDANRRALELTLTSADRAALDAAFPAVKEDIPLQAL